MYVYPCMHWCTFEHNPHTTQELQNCCNCWLSIIALPDHLLQLIWATKALFRTASKALCFPQLHPVSQTQCTLIVWEHYNVENKIFSRAHLHVNMPGTSSGTHEPLFKQGLLSHTPDVGGMGPEGRSGTFTLSARSGKQQVTRNTEQSNITFWVDGSTEVSVRVFLEFSFFVVRQWDILVSVVRYSKIACYCIPHCDYQLI